MSAFGRAPFDSAAASDAAYASVRNKVFPQDIFRAPELRWAVIGCGVVANQMAQTLALAGRHLAGVANRTYEKALAFAERYGVERVYRTFDDLYADPDVDAVYITTPHNTHLAFLRRALAAGKHVLCEKSITLNAAELVEARELAAMVEARWGYAPDVTIMGPVIGSHVGPGAVAVIWKSKEERQD